MSVNTDFQKKQSSLVVALKVAVTIGMFYWVLSQVEIAPLLKIVSGANINYILLAFSIHAVAFILFSLRWWYLYHIQDMKWKYKHILGSYYFGLFCNNFLPTGIGGDVVRIIRLRKAGLNTHVLVSSTLLDRILGLASILMMGLVAVIFTPNLNLTTNNKLMLVLFAVSIALGVVFLFSDYMYRISTYFHKKYEDNRISLFLFNVISTLHEYRRMRTQILFTLLISFLAQYLIIISYLMIGISLSIELPMAIYFTVIPIVFVATSLPISIGGFGVRESTLIYLFVFFQVDKQAAIALSLIYFAIIVLITLPGGLVLLFESAKIGPQKVSEP